MKIGIVANDLVGIDPRGLARYAAGLAGALEDSGMAEVVYFARELLGPAAEALRGRRVIWRGRREVVWEQLELPLRAARERVDVLHATGNRGLPAFVPMPTVLTRHDEIERLFHSDFPGSFRSEARRSWSDAVSLRSATAVVSVSCVSARDTAREWPGVQGKIRVLGEGIDDRFFTSVSKAEVRRVRGHYNLPETYVLYLGGFERRKGVAVVLGALVAGGLRGMCLVLAGSQRGMTQETKALLERLSESGRVRALGRIPDEDICGLVSGALVFVFPSEYEGFGLPVLEAMALGVPVVSSDGGSLAEVTAGAARTFPSKDREACGRALDEVVADAGLRDSLRQRGHQVAEAHRWNIVVEAYLALYRELAT